MSDETLNPRPQQTYTLPATSLLVVPYVRILGGKKILQNDVKREETPSGGVQYRRDTLIHVDNEDERKKAENFATRVRNFARTYAEFTPLGYVAKLEARSALEEQALKIEAEADSLNSELQTCKVVAYVVLLKFGIDLNSDVARALNDNVLSKLQHLKNEVQGKKPGAKNVYNNSKSILKLGTGIAQDAVRYALEEVKEALKTGEVDSLPQLDNAIAMFLPTSESEKASLELFEEIL